MDFSTLIPWICESLNAPSVGELAAWTQDELFHSAEEALHDIGGRFVLYSSYDDTTPLVADQALYELPFLHIATIQANADGVFLQPSTVADLEALDDDYQEAASAAAPTRWLGDELGLGFIRVYPPKNATGTLGLLFHLHPPDLTAAAPVIDMPAPVGDYLAIKTLEAARMRQGDAQMQDAAQAFGTLGGVYEAVFAALWEAA